MPRLQDVFGLYTKMLLGIGLVFQMPTVVFFLAKMKLVTARFLLRNFKYAILIIFVAAAVITPSGDMMTQAIFAAPMLGLYLLSIVIAWVVIPEKRKQRLHEVCKCCKCLIDFEYSSAVLFATVESLSPREVQPDEMFHSTCQILPPRSCWCAVAAGAQTPRGVASAAARR